MVLSHNSLRNFFRLRWATFPINLVVLLALGWLRFIFIKILIFYHYDLKCHIQIETNASSYDINGVLSKITLNNLGW